VIIKTTNVTTLGEVRSLQLLLQLDRTAAAAEIKRYISRQCWDGRNSLSPSEFKPKRTDMEWPARSGDRNIKKARQLCTE